DPVLEFLPDEKELQRRKTEGKGITRPELAILLAYEKMVVKQEILDSDIPDNNYFKEWVYPSFPESLCKKYARKIAQHPLRREIIATQISNNLVNNMGATFIFRLQEETGSTVAEIVRAYMLSAEVFRLEEVRQ